MIHNGDILKFEKPLQSYHKKDLKQKARYVAWKRENGMRIFLEGENFCEDCGPADEFKDYTIIENVNGEW